MDEFNGRLRFIHRGLLGMASNGPHTNGSQFFVTLSNCEWLDKKHTIFGKITGNSLYNVNRFGELECDSKDRPTYPPRIQRTEILLDPFDDIVPREKVVAVDAAAKRPKRKEKKNLSLLSFGEEAAGEERDLSKVQTRVMSSHDVLEDPRLSSQQAVDTDAIADKLRRKQSEAAKREATQSAVADAAHKRGGSGGGGGGGGGGEAAASAEAAGGADDFEERMRKQMVAKKARMLDAAKGGGAAEGAIAGAGASEAAARREARQEELNAKGGGAGGAGGAGAAGGAERKGR